MVYKKKNFYQKNNYFRINYFPIVIVFWKAINLKKKKEI